MEATEYFRPFVFGYPLIIFTDQLSLIWLMEYCHPSRFKRYRERLAPFNATIKYVEGKKNPADFFSRECPKVAAVTTEQEQAFIDCILRGHTGENKEIQFHNVTYPSNVVVKERKDGSKWLAGVSRAIPFNKTERRRDAKKLALRTRCIGTPGNEADGEIHRETLLVARMASQRVQHHQEL